MKFIKERFDIKYFCKADYGNNQKSTPPLPRERARRYKKMHAQLIYSYVLISCLLLSFSGCADRNRINPNVLSSKTSLENTPVNECNGSHKTDPPLKVPIYKSPYLWGGIAVLCVAVAAFAGYHFGKAQAKKQQSPPENNPIELGTQTFFKNLPLDNELKFLCSFQLTEDYQENCERLLVNLDKYEDKTEAMQWRNIQIDKNIETISKWIFIFLERSLAIMVNDHSDSQVELALKCSDIIKSKKLKLDRLYKDGILTAENSLPLAEDGLAAANQLRTTFFPFAHLMLKNVLKAKILTEILYIMNKKNDEQIERTENHFKTYIDTANKKLQQNQT